MNIDLIVIGGGAAGFFGAIAAKEARPEARVVILEKSAKVLSKVRISGGGRCNVTNGCFDVKELMRNYPRGNKELIGPMHRFGPRETVEWFESRGVKLKREDDGRMFPVSDDSEDVIRCLGGEARRLGIEVKTRARVEKLEDLEAEKILLATGSGRDGWRWAKEIGHTIVEPVPSLFTFNVPNFPLADLAGISVDHVRLSVGKLVQEGPLLITHWGFSGPAALKLSAWGARVLHEKNYRVELKVEWLGYLAKRLKRRLEELEVNDRFQVDGKTTYKSEFVTSGGVKLSEIDFRTMESKIRPSVYFAGEILNIDGVTGGFNFQNAWTTGYIAGNAL